MNILGKYKIVPIINTADYNAGVTADSINMAKAHRVTFILQFGAITGDAILYIYSGATDAAKTSALTFKYAYGSAACGSATSDTYTTESTSAALTLTGTTFANRTLVIEVDGAVMDNANNEEWLTLYINADAGAGICQACAIVEPRYSDGTTLLS